MSDGYTVIPYEERYRDDMIFMVLEAKDALGRVPRLNEDLLDIRRHYLDAGDMFWLAVDANDRVIGCIGYRSIPGTTEARLHRLYVKAARKRQGIAHVSSRQLSNICGSRGKLPPMYTWAVRSTLPPAVFTPSTGTGNTGRI